MPKIKSSTNNIRVKIKSVNTRLNLSFILERSAIVNIRSTFIQWLCLEEVKLLASTKSEVKGRILLLLLSQFCTSSGVELTRI